jgi:hypothetical protein
MRYEALKRSDSRRSGSARNETLRPIVAEKGGNKKMSSSDQKTWETPSLTVYGDVATLTLTKDKHFGTTDGFTFNGVPISG